MFVSGLHTIPNVCAIDTTDMKPQLVDRRPRGVDDFVPENITESWREFESGIGRWLESEFCALRPVPHSLNCDWPFCLMLRVQACAAVYDPLD